MAHRGTVSRQWHHERMTLEAATGGDEWMTLHPTPPINQEMCALLIPCWARLISLMDVSIALSSLPAGCIAPSESPVALSMVRDWGLVMVWSKAMPLWCWIAAIPHCQV